MRRIFLRSFCNLSGVLALTAFVFCGASFAQPQIDHTAMTRGPISFGFLQNPRFEELATLDRNGVRAIRFRWTADSGEFSYDLDEGAVLHGRIRRFKLEGIRTELQGANVPTLEVKTGGLTFEFTSLEEVRLNLYGGVLILPVGTTGRVANTQAINIRGPARTNQVGNLQLTFSSPLSWQNAAFQFPRVPNPVIFNLASQAAVPTLIDLPFSNGKLRVAKARFSYTLPPADAAKRFELEDPNYRATVNGLGLGSLTVDLETGKLSLQAQNISGTGEVTARVMKTEPIPVLFTGKASAVKLVGTAAFSETVARMENVILTDLRLDPTSPITPPVAGNPDGSPGEQGLPSVRAEADAASSGLTPDRVGLFLSAKLSTTNTSQPETLPRDEGAAGAKSLTAEFGASRSSPTAPQITNSADFYTASPGQVRAMDAMGMPTLSKRQRASISISHQALQGITAPNFLVNYPKGDFKPLLDRFLRTRGLKLLEVKFGPQEALLLVDVVNSSNPLKLPEAMKFVFRVSPTVERRTEANTNKTVQDLVLRYAIALARVDQTRVGGSTTPDAFLSALDSQVGQANAAAEAEAAPVRFPLPVDVVKTIDLNKTFTDPVSKARVTLASSKRDVTIAATSNAILVDEDGVHLLGLLEIDPPASQPASAEQPPEVDFSTFKTAFQQKAGDALAPDSLQTWGIVSAYISKRFLSRALAAEFNRSEIQIAATFPNQAVSPPPRPVPLTIPRDNSNCDECHHCSGGGPRRWACEAARGACMAATAPIRLLCETKKLAVNALAGTEIGRIEFSGVEAEGSLRQTRLSISIAENLSEASLNANINVDTALSGTAKLKLEPVVKVLTACPLDLNFNLPRTSVGVSASSLPFKNKFEKIPSKEGVNFQLSIEEAELKLDFPLSPLLIAVANNPQNFILCPLPTGAITVAGVFDQIFNFTGTMRMSQNFTTPIGQLTVTIPGRPQKVELEMKDSPLSVGVSEAPARQP